MTRSDGDHAERLGKLLDDDLEDAYENAPAGYVTTLPDGHVIRLNATFLAWTGYSKEQLRDTRFQQLFTVPGRIYYETHLSPLLAMQGSLNEIALDLRRQDGTTLPAMLNAAAKRNGNGDPLLYRFTIFNATDRRRYERQLLEARRQAEAAAQAKTELLAMLSHDIRSPLSSIMSVASILEHTGLAREHQTALRILRSSATAMLALVNEVLEQGRIEAGVITVNRRAADLGELVRELVGNLEPLARNKGISLDCSIDERLPPQVLVDPTKLGQVIGNLVGNALKFTDAGGVHVKLDVLELDAVRVKLRVQVIDTGIGVAEEVIPRILEKYGQAQEGARRGGLGLGLAISRKLLEAHGSELRLRSKPGEGSEFWFDLALDLPTTVVGNSPVSASKALS